MTARRNRHPADELADLRAEIRTREERAEALRQYLIEHPKDRVGDEHEALVLKPTRKQVDLEALAEEVGSDVVERFTVLRSTPAVRLRWRGQP
jgi:hypothetical protein